MTELVVRQTATGSYAIGWINSRKSKGFIPRDGIRFSTREAAESELRQEKRGPLYDIHTRQELTVREWKGTHVFVAEYADGSTGIRTISQVAYADGTKPVSPIAPNAVAQRLDDNGGVMV